MSDGQPRQVQCKLGDVDADGNWQLGSPAPASATDDKTQTVSVTGHKRRAPTPADPPFSARDLQDRHNAAKEKKKTVKSKPVGQGEQPVRTARSRWRTARPTSPWRRQPSARARRRSGRSARPNGPHAGAAAGAGAGAGAHEAEVHALENSVLREQLLFFAQSMPPAGKLDRHRSAGSMTRSMPLPPV